METPSKSALKSAWSTAVSTQKQKKMIEPKDIHTAVRKAINDSLSDLTPEELDGVKVEGESCRDRLFKDKKAWLEGSADFTMGSGYYDGLRALYTGRGRIENQLEYTATDSVPAALVKAIGKARKHPPNRGPLLAYMRTAKSYGRGEIIAILKLMCSLRPSVKVEQAHVGMEIVTLLTQLDVWSTYLDEFAVVRPKLDEILLQIVLSVQSYVNGVSAGVTPIDWLEQYASVWHLVLPVKEIESVKSLEEGQPISNCKAELKTILASSSLGFRLFSWTSTDLASSVVETSVSTVMAGLRKKKTLAAIDLTNAMKKVTELTRAEIAEGDLQKKRSVEISYRGWKIPLVVSSVDEELDIRVKAELRGLACQAANITALPAESDLCNTVTCAVETWSLPFLKAAQRTREFVAKLHTGESKKDGESLVAQISVWYHSRTPCCMLGLEFLPKSVIKISRIKKNKRTELVIESELNEIRVSEASFYANKLKIKGADKL
eukprot:3370516-Amphidinium_carterae.3